VKLKAVQSKITEIENRLDRIMGSKLLSVQKIDAIKTFLLPALDFNMLNGEVGRKQLSTLDTKIRESINQESKVKGLPVECHHASWRDGGLSYPSLQDRNDVLTIRSFTQMLLSEDTQIKIIMRQFIQDEKKFEESKATKMHSFSIGVMGENTQEHRQSLRKQRKHVRDSKFN
jgi:hypothetical protein